ncbi:MAG: Zn-ribbon domain-containing OB-fold protein [Promethearchaeia archaeon]
MSPLPEYIKNTYVKTRTTHGSWYLSSYRYKFNLSRTKVFLKGLKDGVILGLKCRSCNTVSFPPRLICGRCLVKPDQWVRLPETGSLATGSATYEEDDKNREHPFPVVAVRQDGADTVWVHNLPDEYDFHSIYIGMPLKVVWAEERKGLWMDIDHYEPIPDPAQELNKKEWGEE